MPIVSYSADAAIGQIVISRPERRNALNHQALDEMREAVAAARHDQLRVLMLSGDEQQFCSGADLKELEDLEFTRALRVVLDDLAALPFPTLAAISGACMGLGLQLAMACDLRVATAESQFAVPVAKLGLMVDHWTVQRLALLAGHSTARWMLLTARPMHAERAHEVGLIHQIVGGLDEAQVLAAEISRLAPLALSGSKLGLDLLEQSAERMDPGGVYLGAFTTAWTSDDLVEGRRAFGDRRPAQFQGR